MEIEEKDGVDLGVDDEEEARGLRREDAALPRLPHGHAGAGDGAHEHIRGRQRDHRDDLREQDDACRGVEEDGGGRARHREYGRS